MYLSKLIYTEVLILIYQKLHTEKNGYFGLISRYSTICDKHIIYLVVISRYPTLIDKMCILTYFNILGSKAEL